MKSENEKRKGFRPDRIEIALAGIIVYAAAIAAVHLLRPGSEEFYAGPLTTWINIITVLIAIGAGALCLRYFGVRNYQGRSVLALTSTNALWLIADMVWTYSGDALVSWADVLYLAGYPLIMAGIFFGIKTFNPEFTHERRKIAILAAVSIIVSAVYLFVFPLSWDPELTPLENALVAGYVVADIVILVPTVFLVSQVLSGFFSRPWTLIAAATIMNIAADIYYNLNYDTYTGGDLIDVVWYFAYLTYAAAFLLLYRGARSISQSVPEKK